MSELIISPDCDTYLFFPLALLTDLKWVGSVGQRRCHVLLCTNQYYFIQQGCLGQSNQIKPHQHCIWLAESSTNILQLFLTSNKSIVKKKKGTLLSPPCPGSLMDHGQHIFESIISPAGTHLLSNELQRGFFCSLVGCKTNYPVKNRWIYMEVVGLSGVKLATVTSKARPLNGRNKWWD